MEVYFDNASTTRCIESVKDIVVQVMTEDYGNPSSMHNKGVEAEKYIRQAKKILADSMKVQEKEIFFTSGGTESNNLAIIGTALANRRRGMHLITTKIEHPSVQNPMKYMEGLGFQVTWLDVDEYGIVKTDQLEQAICEDTILVSVMHVNNEIGSVQPIEELAKIVKMKNSNTYFHVDSIQGFGKYRIFPNRMGIDLLSISGHKIHGPKGIGVLYVGDKVKLQPTLHGGGQQKGMRSGTENVPGIAGIGKAVEEIYTNHEEKVNHLYKLRNSLIQRLCAMEGVTVNGSMDESGAPHIISANFAGVGSEVLLHSLEDRGIYVSAGSACASNKQAASDTLQAIGLSKEQMSGTIRFSFCTENTMEEVEICSQALEELLPMLRRYQRR